MREGHRGRRRHVERVDAHGHRDAHRPSPRQSGIGEPRPFGAQQHRPPRRAFDRPQIDGRMPRGQRRATRSRPARRASPATRRAAPRTARAARDPSTPGRCADTAGRPSADRAAPRRRRRPPRCETGRRGSRSRSALRGPPADWRRCSSSSTSGGGGRSAEASTPRVIRKPATSDSVHLSRTKTSTSCGSRAERSASTRPGTAATARIGYGEAASRSTTFTPSAITTPRRSGRTSESVRPRKSSRRGSSGSAISTRRIRPFCRYRSASLSMIGTTLASSSRSSVSSLAICWLNHASRIRRSDSINSRPDVGQHDDRLPAVGGVRLAPQVARLLEAGQHLRHRRRLNPLAGRQLAGTHRAALLQRRQGRELPERDGHVGPLLTDQPHEPQQ